MAQWDEFTEEFASIREEWDRAERDIKAAEQINHKVSFPSIKELRYAGRRIVEALNLIEKGDSAEARKRLQDAEFDCHRARHDAIDAGTSKIAQDLYAAAEKLGHDAILAGYPNFSELLRKINSVRKKIQISRENRENREAIYSVIEAEDFIEIGDMYQDFMSAEPMIKAFARRNRKHLLISYGIGAAGVLVAIIVAIFS